MHGSWWREITHFSRQNCWLWTHVSLKMTPVNRDLQRLNQKSLQVSTSLGFTASTQFVPQTQLKHKLISFMQKNTQRNLYTQQLLHTDACPLHRAIFTHRSLYTHMLLHKASQSSFYRQTLSHTHTQMLLHTEAFTRRNQCVCTQKLLHTDAFAQRILHSRRSFYTHTPLHTESFYTQRLFTQRSLYTEQLLHAGAFTHRSFCTEQFHGSNSFALGTRKTICDNIFPTQRSHPCLTNFLVEAAVQCHRFLQHFQCLKRSAVETRGAWKDF